MFKPTSTKAVIFDMDGTLVDNMPFHKIAWLRFLSNHKINLTPEEFDEQNYGNIDEIVRRFFGEDMSDDKIKILGQEKEKAYRDLYRNHVKEINGLTDFLHKLSDLDIKAAIATMGDTPNIDFILDELGIRPYFHSITGGHEVSRGKPDAEIFELSLKKLNLKNHECIVIEDSIGGVLSAIQAGIDVIGITTSHTSGELKKNGCIYTIHDYTDIDLDSIIKVKR